MTAFNKINDFLREAITSGQVAEVAGVDYSIWDAHVMYGRGQMVQGRNRGRLPYVEINILTTDFEQDAIDLDMETIEFELVISTARSLYESTDAAHRILRTILSEFKRLTPHITSSVLVDTPETTPWGSKTSATISIELSSHQDYNEDEF